MMLARCVMAAEGTVHEGSCETWVWFNTEYFLCPPRSTTNIIPVFSTGIGLQCAALASWLVDTVEPPNEGHYEANYFVPCREVVPISEGK